MKSKILLAAAAVGLAFATPQAASAQNPWPTVDGDYVEVSTISVDDGHGLDYANHLAGQWRQGQDFAKSQGWITNYQIWVNSYPRKGEANVWLVTWFSKMADAAEGEKRYAAYLAHMKTTEQKMQADSGGRATYRHLDSDMLFRVQEWKK